MSTISVTHEESQLSMQTCGACGLHCWMQDGKRLDPEQALAAVRQRLAEAPRPKGGRPRKNPDAPLRQRPSRSGPSAGASSAAADGRKALEERERLARQVLTVLHGFEVHGSG